VDSRALHIKNVVGQGVLEFFASHLKTAVIVVDREGSVVFLNSAAERLLNTTCDSNDEFTLVTGYTRNEIIGKPCSILQGDPCLRKCGLYALRSNERIFNSPCRIIGKAGNLITIRKNAALIKTPDGVVCGGVESFVDVSDLKDALEKAEEASAAKSSFLAMMSHENRTPMNGIIELSELLLSSKLNAFDSELIQTINTSATSLLSLLNDILDFSKFAHTGC
jgi:signal transduction histidine kinase